MKALAASPGRLGVSELAQRLGLAKGTVHGLLRTLQAHGLVEQRPDSDKYQLGPELLQLSYRYLDVNELRSRSLMWADRLASRSGESVRVGALHGASILVVHHAPRPDAGLQILEIGETLPLHATALGKAVLAHLDDDVRGDLLDGELARLTGRTITDPERLERELAEVRGHGFATEREEAVLGECGIASPIFDRHGSTVGAVGVVGPAERLRRARVERTASALVIESARGISRELGASSQMRVATAS